MNAEELAKTLRELVGESGKAFGNIKQERFSPQEGDSPQTIADKFVALYDHIKRNAYNQLASLEVLQKFEDAYKRIKQELFPKHQPTIQDRHVFPQAIVDILNGKEPKSPKYKWTARAAIDANAAEIIRIVDSDAIYDQFKKYAKDYPQAVKDPSTREAFAKEAVRVAAIHMGLHKYLAMNDNALAEKLLAYNNNQLLNEAKSVVEKFYAKLLDKTEEQTMGNSSTLKTSSSKEENMTDLKKIKKIFIDMDGVLCDFWKAVQEKMGIDLAKLSDEDKEELAKGKDFVEKIKDSFGISEFKIKDTFSDPDFWADMQWLPQGKKLIEHLMSKGDYDIYVLTAPSKFAPEECKRGKRIWLEKNLPELAAKVIFEYNKYEHAEPDALLIDDNEIHTDSFKTHGGESIKVPSQFEDNRDEKYDKLLDKYIEKRTHPKSKEEIKKQVEASLEEQILKRHSIKEFQMEYEPIDRRVEDIDEKELYYQQTLKDYKFLDRHIGDEQKINNYQSKYHSGETPIPSGLLEIFEMKIDKNKHAEILSNINEIYDDSNLFRQSFVEVVGIEPQKYLSSLLAGKEDWDEFFKDQLLLNTLGIDSNMTHGKISLIFKYLPKDRETLEISQSIKNIITKAQTAQGLFELKEDVKKINKNIFIMIRKVYDLLTSSAYLKKKEKTKTNQIGEQLQGKVEEYMEKIKDKLSVFLSKNTIKFIAKFIKNYGVTKLIEIEEALNNSLEEGLSIIFSSSIHDPEGMLVNTIKILDDSKEMEIFLNNPKNMNNIKDFFSKEIMLFGTNEALKAIENISTKINEFREKFKQQIETQEKIHDVKKEINLNKEIDKKDIKEKIFTKEEFDRMFDGTNKLLYQFIYDKIAIYLIENKHFLSEAKTKEEIRKFVADTAELILSDKDKIAKEFASRIKVNYDFQFEKFIDKIQSTEIFNNTPSNIVRDEASKIILDKIIETVLNEMSGKEFKANIKHIVDNVSERIFLRNK